jgi:hypothetical protein
MSAMITTVSTDQLVFSDLHELVQLIPLLVEYTFFVRAWTQKYEPGRGLYHASCW